MNKQNEKGSVDYGTLVAGLIVVAVIGGGIFTLIRFIDWNNRHNSERGRGDAQVGTVNNDPRTVYQMPDRFKNIALVCDEFGNAIYSTTADGGGAQMYAVRDGCTK